ncbi:hypothetical protein [Stenotrophomonas acidaminiphila]
MIKKTLKTVMFLVVVAASGLASAQLSPCSQCDVQLHRCLENGVFTPEQCEINYQRCKADFCPAP